MIKCKRCGKDVPDNVAFCPACGAAADRTADDKTGPVVARPEPDPFRLLDQPVSPGKKRALIMVVIGVLIVAALVGGYLALGDKILGKRAAFPGVSRTGATPEVDEQFQNMQQMADQIEQLERDIQTKGTEMARLQRDFESKGGKLPVGGVAFTDEERKLLADLQKNEKADYRDLLDEILAKDKEIWDIKARLSAIEEQLPRPHIAKSGERHRDVSIRYLMDTQKLSRKDAESLVDRVNLMEPLLPGFKVWNFYMNGAFGTYVTQGTAPINPNEAERRKIQAIVDERNAAYSERDALQVEVGNLQAHRTELTEQVASLNTERATLTTEVEELKGIQAGLEADLNSVYFRTGTKKELIKAGIIKDPILGSVRLENFTSKDFTGQIDLRSMHTITLLAEGSGLQKIKKAIVLPAIFKENIDYRVIIPKDGTEATVEILNPDKFRFQKIVVAVE
ncbi:MAG: zinc-ribbon domain-containing protein [Acidobacteriota bacterium]